MKNVKMALFGAIVILSFTLQAVAGEHQTVKTPDVLSCKLIKKPFPGVTKISNDLYTGKVRDEFYVAMERVDKNTVNSWLAYSQLQEHQAQQLIDQKSQCLKDKSGMSYTKLVLGLFKKGIIDPTLHDLWIAYASTTPVTGTIKLNIDGKTPNSSIDMFMTVITSQNALLTSHMGISRTVESATDLQEKDSRRKKHPYQSMDLQSFAAKVMLLQNSQKKYMLNPPVVSMRSIMLKTMPKNSVFIGDNLYQKELEKVKKNNYKGNLIFLEGQIITYLDEFNTINPKQAKTLPDPQETQYQTDFIDHEVSGLNTNPPRIIRKGNTFTIQNNDTSPLVTFDSSSKTYQWLFTQPYEDIGLIIPYVLVDLNELANVRKLDKNYIPQI